MSGAPNLGRGAVDARRVHCGSENSRHIPSHMVKGTYLHVAEVATAMEKFAGLGGRKPCYVRRGLDIVKAEAGLLVTESS